MLILHTGAVSAVQTSEVKDISVRRLDNESSILLCCVVGMQDVVSASHGLITAPGPPYTNLWSHSLLSHHLWSRSRSQARSVGGAVLEWAYRGKPTKDALCPLSLFQNSHLRLGVNMGLEIFQSSIYLSDKSNVCWIQLRAYQTSSSPH